MKRYKLLKDLPFAKAGEEFKEMHNDGRIVLAPEDWDQHRHEIDINDIKNFDEWFEEIKELEQIYYVDSLGGYVSKIEKNRSAIFPTRIANLKSIGNYFETEEEAKKYLAYLKAKAIIKEDTKGFKPDWNNEDENRYRGCWDLKKDTTIWMYESGAFREPLIFFKSVKDVKESFEKHPNEWRTYLTYEQ
ncbi:MAG: hypothetical protein HXK95_03605 [Candidatus Nanogingivalaceae bacterium]|nr:MAG: hypothetical protein HXK95_03605 [Candidatus Nanogingivalaceae bacterium]